MSQLRTQIKHAKIAYQQYRYPGDLAAELLSSAAGPQLITKQRSLKIFQYLPYIAGGIAVMVAIGIYRQPVRTTPPGREIKISTVIKTPVETVRLAQLLDRLNTSQLPKISPTMPDVSLDVNAHVQDTLNRINSRVESALEVPLVSESMDTVKEVAMGFREVAFETWMQVMPQRKPGC